MKLTKDEVVKRIKEIHGEKYGGVEDINYINIGTKIKLICPTHNDFYITPKSLFNGCGCRQCSQISNANKVKSNANEFIKKAKIIHKERYKYEQVEYINAMTKVKIGCPIHGIFEQTPSKHLSGQGCPKCGHNSFMTTETLIKEAHKIHGDKYDYSKTEYIDYDTKVCIICPEHGEFWQYPYQHINRKNGCPKCGNIAAASKLSKTREEFIKDAIQIHGDKYTFEDLIYKNSSTHIKVNCRKHGLFEITPANLLQGYGCPKCRCTFSKEEKEVDNFISELNVNTEKLKLKNGQELDIYIPDEKMAFEFDGLYWHCELKKDKYYHSKKTYYCKEQDIRVIHIFEDEWLNKREVVESRIRNLLRKNHSKIYARKCILQKLDKVSVKQFLYKNYLGYAFAPSINYCLKYDNEIVAIMSFKNIKGDSYELCNFCTILNTTVIGGFSKLLRHFILDFKPKDIISYVDKRWNCENNFVSNGFKHIKDTDVDYTYIIGHKRENKSKYCKRKLVEQGFDKNKTEHNIMYERGIYRIYDCGRMIYRMEL